VAFREPQFFTKARSGPIHRAYAPRCRITVFFAPAVISPYSGHSARTTHFAHTVNFITLGDRCFLSTGHVLLAAGNARHTNRKGESVAKAKKSTAGKGKRAVKARTAGKKATKRKTTEKTSDSNPPVTDKKVTIDRRSSGNRRKSSDRRRNDVPVAVERRTIQRRAKVIRRRQIDPTTCERDYTGEEIEFMNALDEYKRTSGRMFPTCSEILEVLKKLGYAKRPKTEAPGLPELDLAGESVLQEVVIPHPPSHVPG